MIRNRKLRRAMKDPKTNRAKKPDTRGDFSSLGFCPFCKILTPTLTVEKKRLGSLYTISCICKESEGAVVKSRSKKNAMKKWRKKNVD